MASPILGPRQPRTRPHVIADWSVHHREGFIRESGHTSQRLGSDYGYDLIWWTFDAQGYAEPGAAYFQLKAMETLTARGTDCVFDLDLRDDNWWLREAGPVILVRFDASRRRVCWLPVQGYFREASSRRPRKGAKPVRVRVPRRQGWRDLPELRAEKRFAPAKPPELPANSGTRCAGPLGLVQGAMGSGRRSESAGAPLWAPMGPSRPGR
jgi:hypothetical protein